MCSSDLSPNSVGEAQLIGTPCIASYTGGIMDMITDNETGFLYRYEEIALLAQRVCELFENSKLCEKLIFVYSSQNRFFVKGKLI